MSLGGFTIQERPALGYDVDASGYKIDEKLLEEKQGTKLRLDIIKSPVVCVAESRITRSALAYVVEHVTGTETPQSVVDLSKIPSQFTNITFEASEGLNSESLSTLPDHVINLAFVHISWIISARVGHLTSLRVLELNHCNAHEMQVPDQLETLLLNSVKFLKWGSPSPFSLGTVHKVRNITLKDCENITVEFPENQVHYVESLKITGCGLKDENFRNFPLSLKHCRIKEAITSKTIEKLGRGLQSLNIKGCNRVKMHPERAQLLFGECVLEGFKERVSRADKYRRALEKSVIGQPQAIQTALGTLCTSLAGLGTITRPVGVLLFVGPSGVGKTELARAMASVGNRKFLRYDMSEYQLEHEVAKLTGAPSGYEGSAEGSRLINEVTDHPEAIVLFDEIEKAHANIHRALLGIFDAGRLTDGKGKTGDFTKTIIIMTSNLGSNRIVALDWDQLDAALRESETIVLNLLKQKIAPEFAGRIDRVVPFRPLNGNIMREIMKAKILDYGARMQQEGFELEILDSAWEPLFENADFALGVRPIIRQCENEINAEISKALVNCYIKKGAKLQVSRETNNKIKLQLRD